MLAGLFLIGGYIPYIRDVFRGTDIPNRASWFIWSLSTVTLLIGVKETGTNEAIWVPIADAVGCVSIFILSIKHGVGGWSTTDKLSFAICFLSLAIWAYTGNVMVALITNLLVYVSGYISTIKKEIDTPGGESKLAWTMFLIGVLLNLMTVIIGSDKGFAVWLYPVVLVGTVGTLYYFILFPAKRKA
jgi:hypothetical protein